MKNEIMLLNKKHTCTMIDQRRNRPQEKLEFKSNGQMEIFRSILQKMFPKKVNWLLAVTSFGATNSVFIRTDENISFSTSKPTYWSPEDGEEHINKLKEFLELRSENDIELHVEEV